jgi:hypothetical protein
MVNLSSFHHPRRNKQIILASVGLGISLLLGLTSFSLPQQIINDVARSLRNHDYDAAKTSPEQHHWTNRTRSITTRKHDAMWDLLPWEEVSRSGQCKGPTTATGVSTSVSLIHESLSKTTEGHNMRACCPGALSGGGAVQYNGQQSKCYGDMFDRVAAATKSYLAQDYNATSTFLTAGPEKDNAGGSHTNNNNNNDIDDYSACDACRIVDLMILNNWTLSFSGDSMLRQNFVGLQCEIMRRISREAVNSNTTTTYRTKILPRRIWPRDPTIFWRRGVHNVEEVHIYHGDNTNHPDSSNNNNYARILFFANYRPLDDNNTELEYIAQQSDIIVFDHGLHYLPNQFKDMIERTRTLLPALKAGSNNKVKLVAWRETSSQHFNTTHGEYMPGVTEQGCHPIRHPTHAGTLRSDNMVQAAKLANWTVAWANDPHFSTTPPPSRRGGQDHHHQHDDDDSVSHSIPLGELVILPFRKFTHDLHYAHGTECTHYCSSPHLWLPVWRALRLSMDRLLLL